MKVELAKMAGFCFGVNRAVDTVYQEAVEHSPVYTYGPIIHNEEVIADLKRKGVQVIHSLEEAKEQAEGTVIIRSHGVTKAEQETLVADGLRVIDATCPFVKKIHRLVQEYSDKGECCDLAEIEKDISERDYRDMHREIAPLKAAEDAVMLDSSELNIDEVVEAIYEYAKKAGLEA